MVDAAFGTKKVLQSKKNELQPDYIKTSLDVIILLNLPQSVNLLKKRKLACIHDLLDLYGVWLPDSRDHRSLVLKKYVHKIKRILSTLKKLLKLSQQKI